MITRKEVHAILDRIIDEAKDKALYGSVSFAVHFQGGVPLKISDEGWKRTWVGDHGKQTGKE